MKVIILAAGRGSRLGERTANLPKCMCKLCGRTLLNRCLESLEKGGIKREEIAIVTGYKSEVIRIEGVKYFHNPDWEKTNMFVSLTKASEWLEKEPCIVCYSDVVFSSEVIKRITQTKEELVVPYFTKYWELWSKRMKNPLDDLETFKLNSAGQLTEIGLHPEKRVDIQGQYMGLIKFTPESWAAALETIKHPLPKTVEKLDMTTLLNGMIKDGNTISTFPNDEMWLECDTGDDIEFYEKEFTDKL